MLLLGHREQVKDILLPLTVGLEDVDMYFMGTSRSFRSPLFHPKLSDLDLLYTPEYNSLEGYAKHFQQATKIAFNLRKSQRQLVDVFVLSPRILGLWLACLSVLTDSNKIYDEDCIFYNSGKRVVLDSIIPTAECSQALYVAMSEMLYEKHNTILPFADTTKARKTAKDLLKWLKLIICANTPPSRLFEIETKLFSVATFKEIKPFFDKTTNINLQTDVILDSVLRGNNIEDWAAWMVAQEALLKQLDSIRSNPGAGLKVNNRRLFEGMCRAYTMLVMTVKAIVVAKNEARRSKLIEEFAFSTASVLVQLALSGVKSLESFEGAPKLIVESYEVLEKHLSSNARDDRLLAASAILLEYALKKSILVANSLG